ncbi:MAG: hypothetical protein ACRCX4_04730 [Bacteroidales bacterium]
MDNAIKAIFFKEWIKTRLVILFFSLLSLGYLLFNLAIWYRIATFKGASHLWEIVIGKNTVLIQNMQYIPVIFGIILAVFQFIPEIREKRLKLTLHLPVNHSRIAFYMISYGLMIMAGYSILQLIIIGGTAFYYFPGEVVSRIISTSLIWYLAGFMSYLLTSRIILEGIRKYCLLHFIFSVLILSWFFETTTPGAYTTFIPVLLLLCANAALWIDYSIVRFKQGKRE